MPENAGNQRFPEGTHLQAGAKNKTLTTQVIRMIAELLTAFLRRLFIQYIYRAQNQVAFYDDRFI
jgi:hypothetical protein